jgi:hypothetical protein
MVMQKFLLWLCIMLWECTRMKVKKNIYTKQWFCMEGVVQLHTTATLLQEEYEYWTTMYDTRLDEFLKHSSHGDRLCGLVVGVLGYRSGGPGSIPGTTKKKK